MACYRRLTISEDRRLLGKVFKHLLEPEFADDARDRMPRSACSVLFIGVLLALTLLQVVETAQAQQDKLGSDVSTPASFTPAMDGKGPQESSQEVLTFKKQVNLVVVPVVVLDKKGKAVGSLERQDFQIFDDGKLQSISTFSIERGDRAHRSSVLGNMPTDKVLGPAPSHFLVYLFDDVHLHAGDLMQVRVAAKKHLASGMGPNDRAAVFTTSSDVTLKFTNDKAQLSQAMDRIKPGFSSGGRHCPYMNYYLAQKIMDEFGGSMHPAWDGATDDVWNCLFNRSEHLELEARQEALDAARQEVQVGNENTRRALLAIQNAVRRLAAMPGTRTLILISPGFQTGDDHVEQNTAISLATERNIVINALDARGLYTGIPGVDSENGPSTTLAAQLEDPINRQGLFLQTNVMAELTDGTGGKFFRDNNDLLGGFDQLATPPESIYVLAFRPDSLKKGGQYHRLKIVVGKNHDWTVQARRGYYETAGTGGPEKLLYKELEQALFSHEEIRTLPIALKAEYSKKDGSNRELSVTTRIDLSGINFHKVNNTNVDDLTVVCGLFDLNGNYLQGKKREISLRLADDVLKQFTDGMNVKTTFDVESGAYLIRVVVRDSGNGLLSTVNASGLVQ
jgi:VWFA-related protein